MCGIFEAYSALKIKYCGFIYLDREIRGVLALRKSIGVTFLTILAAIIITIIEQEDCLWIVVSLVSGLVMACLPHCFIVVYKQNNTDHYNDDEIYIDDTRENEYYYATTKKLKSSLMDIDSEDSRK